MRKFNLLVRLIDFLFKVYDGIDIKSFFFNRVLRFFFDNGIDIIVVVMNFLCMCRKL